MQLPSPNSLLFLTLNIKQLAGSALDLAALKIVSGKRCWVLQVDGLVLSADGNLLGALSMATKVYLAMQHWVQQIEFH